jgi:hypothetical protein
MAITINGSGTVTGISATGISAQPVFPGNVLQVVEANYSSTTSTTSQIPVDSTIPQNTEGTELLTLAITPTATSNKLLIQVNVPYIVASANTMVTLALFQDSTVNALSTVTQTMATGNYSYSSALTHYMSAGTTSSTTFKLRYGPGAADTAYINRFVGGGTMGGVSFVRITIWEIAA